MMYSHKKILSCGIIPLFFCFNTYASEGKLSGQLQIDDSWSPVIYLSYIPNYNELNTISNNMIISWDSIDSLGNFEMDISFLPKGESLFRLHLVKKDYPPNTLIIGGKDENHFFFLANGEAEIRIKGTKKFPIFGDVKIEGYSDNLTFQHITKIAAQSNDEISLVSSLAKKELIEKATSEKLRIIADTCKNPLVSLYAIYKSGFENNYSTNLDFYNAYNKKWRKNESAYFNAFRKKLGTTKNRSGLYVALVILSLLFSFSVVYIFKNKKKKNPLKDLSIQERRIFTLIQEGLSNQQISDECNIGLNTVKTHVRNIFSKLNVKSRKDIFNL